MIYAMGYWVLLAKIMVNFAQYLRPIPKRPYLLFP